MAEVVLARQKLGNGVERTVVIKRVLPHIAADPEFIRMFATEIRLAQRLKHPNIVQVIDAHSEGSEPYLVLEALFGADLRTIIREANRRSTKIAPALACAMIAQAAKGLHYAHTLEDELGIALGIVHRDVSPQNIFVTRDGSVRVIDFGIAKSAEQIESTRTGVTKGKPGYMSPEQLRGQRAIDGRVDVYALGVVLWELLAGKRLWKRDSDIGSAMAILQETPQKPSSFARKVPATLDALTTAMLARNPADRPTMAQVEERLERIARELGCWSPRTAIASLIAEMVPEHEDGFEVATVATGAIDSADDDPREDDRGLSTSNSGASTAAHVLLSKDAAKLIEATAKTPPSSGPLVDGARGPTRRIVVRVVAAIAAAGALAAATLAFTQNQSSSRQTAAQATAAHPSPRTTQPTVAATGGPSPALPPAAQQEPVLTQHTALLPAQHSVATDASTPVARSAKPSNSNTNTNARSTRGGGHSRPRGLSTHAVFND